MSQDVVTARDVAAPIADIVQLLDTQFIREKLDAALADEEFDRAIYSDPVLVLFQQAWAVAAHKRNLHVTIHHLAYALVFNRPEDGRKLAEYLGSDVDSFAIGCILQILSNGVAEGAKFSPTVGTTRWLSCAVARCRERDTGSELLTEDLVGAVLDGRLPASERRGLRKAALVGNARRDAVLGPKSAPSIADAPSFDRNIIMHLEGVESGGANFDPADEVGYMVELLEKLGERHAADVADQKQALVRIDTMIGKAQALAGQPVPSNGDFITKLEAIDSRVAAMKGALPRPPSGVRLASAIVVVLTIGAGAGLALTLLQPKSPTVQAASASAK